MIKYIFFNLPLGLNNHFISVLQYFVVTWAKMGAHALEPVGRRKSRK